MMAIDTGLPELERRHPEWRPWLAVIGEILREAADPSWDAVVPATARAQDMKAPLLDGVILTLKSDTVRRVLEALVRTARRIRTAEMATVERALHPDVDVPGLFTAALVQDSECLVRTASNIGADPAALQAVASLLPFPFLQACHRRWAPLVARSWGQGYCPVCGAWPALAEVRGIERSRHLRCGRCGGAWESHALRCPYCGMTDHHELVSLVPDSGRTNAVIDACRRCRGYLKALTTLQGSPPAGVLLDDLASADLDVAALEQGYERPAGAGYTLTLAVR